MINKKKIITMEDLANMVAKGFDSVDSRFKEIDSRFKEIEYQMVTKEEFRSLGKKVDKLDYQIDEIHDILKRFEDTDILNLQKRVQMLEKVVRSLVNRLMK